MSKILYGQRKDPKPRKRKFSGMMKRDPKVMTPKQAEEARTKDFFDCILPGTVKFMSDHYIVGDSYRCVWAIREYPPSTEEQAILSQLADRNGVTLRIYNRLVEPMEQRKIIQNATRRNTMKRGGSDMNDTIEAEGNLQDVIELLANLRKNREPLLHCSVFIELKAKSMDALKELQSEIAMELTRSKLSVDRLTLRQKEGFISVLPVGSNMFGAQYERVLPASSVANLYPFNFSGKTDPKGIYIGRDKYGTNILVDFDRRAEDKTTSNILILGNSGQGKSYLLKLILSNIRESGKSVICLDPEAEYEELCSAMGGCYIDFLSGEHIINPLEPKAWADGFDEIDSETPDAFRKATRLSQHIAFLKDFFRSYKDFTDSQIDTIEMLLAKLYARFGITDFTDYSKMKPTDFPIMSDFYKLCEEEFMTYDKQRKYLYTEQTLQEVCLGINSMCVGAESRFFISTIDLLEEPASINYYSYNSGGTSTTKTCSQRDFEILDVTNRALMACLQAIYAYYEDIGGTKSRRRQDEVLRKIQEVRSQSAYDFEYAGCINTDIPTSTAKTTKLSVSHLKTLHRDDIIKMHQEDSILIVLLSLIPVYGSAIAVLVEMVRESEQNGEIDILGLTVDQVIEYLSKKTTLKWLSQILIAKDIVDIFSTEGKETYVKDGCRMAEGDTMVRIRLDYDLGCENITFEFVVRNNVPISTVVSGPFRTDGASDGYNNSAVDEQRRRKWREEGYVAD